MRALSVSDCACRPPACSLAFARYCALIAATAYVEYACASERAAFGVSPVTLDADQRRIGDDAGRDARADVERRRLELRRGLLDEAAVAISTTNVLASAIEALIWSLYELPALPAVSTRMSTLAW